MKIGVSDINNFGFSTQLIKHWESIGHTVVKSIYHETSFVNECDVVFYDFASTNVDQLTKEGVKPKNCIVRAIDVDIYYGNFNNFNYDFIDSFVVISEHTKRLVEHVVPPSKLKVIPCGIDLTKYSLKEANTGKNAVYLGRFWIGKNVAGAIDVVEELNKIDPGWSLYLRGEGFDPPWWKKYVEHRISTASIPVYIEGYQEDLNSYLQDKDLMIVPSFKEAFSYAGAEAMAKGIPVLFNHWYGADEVWGSSYVYRTPTEAANTYINTIRSMHPSKHRILVETRYDEKMMFQAIDQLLEGK